MIINGWYCCPKCKQKLFKVNKDFVMKGIQLKCKKCKTIINIDEPKSLSH